MVKIGIIIGSTRPGRFAIQPATWLKSVADKRSDAEYELVDLAEINLPLLDEAAPPMMKQYSNDHTKAWSEKVASYDAYVIVTPEYNHSVPAALKNAIDYVYYEWNYKPVSFVSYGSAAGGARVVEHLRAISAEMKMYDIREQVMLHNYWGDLNDKGEYQFSEDQEKAATDMLDQLVVWAETMKPTRDQLSQA